MRVRKRHWSENQSGENQIAIPESDHHGSVIRYNAQTPSDRSQRLIKSPLLHQSSGQIPQRASIAGFKLYGFLQSFFGNQQIAC